MGLQVTGTTLLIKIEPLPEGIVHAGGALYGVIEDWDREGGGLATDHPIAKHAEAGTRVFVKPGMAWQAPAANDGIVRYFVDASGILAFHAEDVAAEPASQGAELPGGEAPE